MNRPETVNDDHVDDAVLQISGAGHWFLEGWIGDHSVEFLIDSGSSVMAMSDSLYQTLAYAGAPVGALGCTSRTLRSANGTGIGVSGFYHCIVSFMGLLTEFPILVCDLASGTDAIICTDVLGSVLPHTLDIKNGLLFTDGDASLQYIGGMPRFPATFSQLAIAPFHLIQRLYSIIPYVLLAGVLCHPVGCWRASPFLQKTLVSSSAELW